MSFLRLQTKLDMRFSAFMTAIRASIVGHTSISTSIATCQSGRSVSFPGRLVM
jgi:hypothetical protein